MKDKMMRIAGRGNDGLAKALRIDDVGNVSVSDSDMEKIAGINAGLRSELYYEGVEVVSWTSGYTSGSGSVTKEKDYISVKLIDNASNIAEITAVTDEGVDLTGVDFIIVDMSIERQSQYATNAYVVVGTSKKDSAVDNAAKSEYIKIEGSDTFPRQKVKLNVSTLTGIHFIRVHLMDVAPTVPIPAELKIYGVWTERSIPQVKNTLIAKDTNNNNVDLTSILDENGKAVLRVVDAAPFAYNEVEDRLKIEGKRKIVIETIFEDVKFQAQGYIERNINFSNESEIWVVVNCDKKFNLNAGSIFSLRSSLSATLFPKLQDVPANTSATPTVALFTPIPPTTLGLVEPITIEQVKLLPLMPGANEYRFSLYNNSLTEEGTATLKIIRVWK